MWHKGSGYIKYDPPRPGMKNKTVGWCVINVDKEITRYYRWWIDKELTNPLKFDNKFLCQPSWDAHISLIRGEIIKPELKNLWKKYDGQKIDFIYEHNPKFSEDKTESDTGYFWYVDVKSDAINEIRKEIGLRTYDHYHLTVGRSY